MLDFWLHRHFLLLRTNSGFLMKASCRFQVTFHQFRNGSSVGDVLSSAGTAPNATDWHLRRRRCLHLCGWRHAHLAQRNATKVGKEGRRLLTANPSLPGFFESRLAKCRSPGPKSSACCDGSIERYGTRLQLLGLEVLIVSQVPNDARSFGHLQKP